jgi:hypothetical protein
MAAAAWLVLKLPPSADTSTCGTRVRPLRVMMLTTPDSASVPYITLFDCRSTSIRSTPAVAICAKSNAPPMSLAATPSMHLVEVRFPPVNIDVVPPRWRLHDLRARHEAALRRVRLVERLENPLSMTVTGAPVHARAAQSRRQ